MRGSPFGFEDFSRGLNVIDSPYTLQRGEARDCLNVVSTPRGAVKKRSGSVTFCNALNAAFPTAAILDTFNRANEKPLSNGGKWELVGNENGYSATGEVVGEKYVTGGSVCAALWNVAEITNPAVSIEATTVEAAGSGTEISLLACMKKGTKLEGYTALWKKAVDKSWTVSLLRWNAGVSTVVATTTKVALKDGDSIGVSVREGKVRAWLKTGGAWSVVTEGADAAFTKGYSGMALLSAIAVLDVIRSGEMPAPTILSSPFRTLASVVVGGTPYLIVSSGTKLYSINAAGEASEIKGGLTSGLKWSVVQSEVGTRVVGQGPVYLSNGTDAPLYWTGATKSTEAQTWTAKTEGEFNEVPKAKYLVYFANRIWAAGVTTAKWESAIQFSGFASAGAEGEKADPTNWPKENTVYFEKEDGDKITGLGIVGPYLLVFKKHKTWVIYDLNEGENRRISDSVGCVSHRSIVETPQGTFFLTPDQGVFVTNGSNVKEVSRSVRPVLQGTDSDTGRAAKVNELENAAGGFYNGHYYLSYIAQDGTQKTLDYDTVLQSWWLHDLAGNQWVLWEPTTGSPALYTIPEKAEAGVVKAFVAGVYQDSGNNYTGKNSLTGYWISPWEPFFQYVMRHRINQPQVKKRIRQLFLDGSGQVIAFVYKNFSTSSEILKGTVDNADESTPTSPVTLGVAPEAKAARYYSLGTARVWGFGFGNNSAEPFEVDSYAVDLAFRKS